MRPPRRTLLTLGTLAVALGMGTAAKAEDTLALSFDLKPSGDNDVADDSLDAVDAQKRVSIEPEAEAPLPIPQGAENPPVSDEATQPSGVYGGADALALGAVESAQNFLPEPPPVLSGVLTEVPPIEESIVPAQSLGVMPEEPVDLALAFNLNDTLASVSGLARSVSNLNPFDSEIGMNDRTQKRTSQTKSYEWTAIHALFEGDADSLVARAVGSAEGTRTPEGHKTPAYFGHVDPGNGVWNLGTFSYQHNAQDPEEADNRQLQRLQRQTKALKRKARDRGMELSQEELLNGIDLANQAPLAALDRGGYIDWLKEAQNLGMEGSEAIVWARTRSFIDPDTQRWNAPGLGNNIHSIHRDQERRTAAIARAIAATELITRAPQASVSAQKTVESVTQSTAVGMLASAEDMELDFLFEEERTAATPIERLVNVEPHGLEDTATGNSLTERAEKLPAAIAVPDVRSRVSESPASIRSNEKTESDDTDLVELSETTGELTADYEAVIDMSTMGTTSLPGLTSTPTNSLVEKAGREKIPTEIESDISTPQTSSGSHHLVDKSVQPATPLNFDDESSSLLEGFTAPAPAQRPVESGPLDSPERRDVSFENRKRAE